MAKIFGSRTARTLVLAIGSALVLGVGCGVQPPPAAPAKPPTVLFSYPVERQVSRYVEYPGYTGAFKSIEIRARVSGYLDKQNFKDGEEVPSNQLLFEIDPRPYQAEMDRAESALAQSEAHAKLADADFRRATDNYSKGVISRSELDAARGTYDESRAMVGVAKASRDTAKLNLSFTKVFAPIDGRMSNRRVDPGNLVKSDETILTNIVALDPIYINFDIDDATMLEIQRLIREGKMKSRLTPNYEVLIKAGDRADLENADEALQFPHVGKIDFSENRVDSTTGTLRVRAVLPNPKPPGVAPRILSPGNYMRIRLEIGQPHMVLMVPEQALGTDQGEVFLYVLDERSQTKDQPISIRVKVGVRRGGYAAIEIDDPKVVAEKLKNKEPVLLPKSRVIVSGLQRVVKGKPLTPIEAKPPLVPEPPPSDAPSPSRPAGDATASNPAVTPGS